MGEYYSNINGGKTMIELIQPHSDIIIMVCSIIFSVSLIPQVIYNFRNNTCGIPLTTSVPTAIGLYIMSTVYISNNWMYAATIGLLTAVMWTTILIQKLKYR